MKTNIQKRKILTYLIVLSLPLGMLCTTGASAEPKSYPLVCRGGGSPFQLNVGVGGSDKSNLTITFRGASAGASVRPPERGQCAWLDRGWRGGEPETMTWSGKLENVSLSFSPNGRLSSVTLGNSGGAGNEIRYLLNAVKNNQTFQLHAYRDTTRSGQHYLRITRVGP